MACDISTGISITQGPLTVVWSVSVIFFHIYVSSHRDKWKTMAAEFGTSYVRREKIDLNIVCKDT